ncbi:MAG: hypothetical protein JST81_01730 [Bacteroidetes bacterium]|nr:hypothetical protein [Bacteroidota bacterium]
MKKNLFIFMIAFASICRFAFAQAPNAIPYQGVARNASGALLSSQPISLRLSIRNGSANGSVVYSETQNPTTTALGLFSVNIGQGVPVSGTLSAVDWSNGNKYLQVELDAAGGNSYADMGTTQLNSVPYAFYAANSGDWKKSGNNISNANTGSVGIGNSNPASIPGASVLHIGSDVSNPSSGQLVLSKRNGNNNAGSMKIGLNDDYQMSFSDFNAQTGSNTEFMVINRTGDNSHPAGRVGIGTNTPSQLLDVNGNVNIANNLMLRGTKVASNDGAGRTQFFNTNGSTLQMEFNGFNTTFFNYPVYSIQNVGIGLDPATESIGASLHVKGNVKIADGTQGTGKVLTSDANGVAHWQAKDPVKHSIEIPITSLNATYFGSGVSFGNANGVPCIDFADGNTDDLSYTIPFPSQVNPTNYSVKVYYTSTTNTGDFDCSNFGKGMNVGNPVVFGPGGGGLVVPAPATAMDLMMGTTDLGNAGGQVGIVHFVLRRRGASANDTSTGVMKVLGIVIEWTE